MPLALEPDVLLPNLRALQAEIRELLRHHMATQEREVWSRTAREGAGDTVFGLDVAVEDLLLRRCREWGEQVPFVLVAEGLDPDGVAFGGGKPAFRLLVDPIDGTRGLMFDKRSAWVLMGLAPDKGDATRLSDVLLAVMTELPTTRQATSDCLWAVRGGGASAERVDLTGGGTRLLPVVPSQDGDLRHGFVSLSNFFPCGRELTAAFEERVLRAALGEDDPTAFEVYFDQYLCTGGQIAELALGRDRFALDVRPLIHERLGKEGLCCRPYDLCTMLVAQEAGCVLCAPDGGPLDAPLDLTTDVAFAGYANRELWMRLQPAVADAAAWLRDARGPGRPDPPPRSTP